MGKKQSKKGKDFPKHIVTGVAVASLAFGVLTNASEFKHLFTPQNYSRFEKQLKHLKSDYVSGKGKNTDLADKNQKNQKNSGNNLQQASKLSDHQTNVSTTKSDFNLSDDQKTKSNIKNPNTFSLSAKEGDGTIQTNPNNSSKVPSINPESDHSSNSNNNSSNTKPSDIKKDPSTPNNPTTPDIPGSDDDHNDDSGDKTTWEEDQLKPKDTVETKYGTIKKLSATITKEEYTFGEKFNENDAIVTGTFLKNGKLYTKKLPYGGDDGYKISFSTKKLGTLSAVFSFGGLTTRTSYKVSENHVVISFFVLYGGEYYVAQFKGDIFDFLSKDVQNYLTSLNRAPYIYPSGGSAVNLSDMHSRMIAYLLDDKARVSMTKLDGNYRNVNFLEEDSDGYLKTMLEGFRFITNKQLADNRSYIYYPTDKDGWNYVISSKQIANTIVSVPKDFKIKRTTSNYDDWKYYHGEQILEKYNGTDENLNVPMGVTKIKLIAKPANAKVKTITLPESVNEIDTQSIVKYVKDFKEYAYEYPDDARATSYVNYRIIDGVLYSKDGTTLLSVPPGRTKKLVIPSTVTTLAKGCFENVSLDKIYFEDEFPPSKLGDTGYKGTVIVPDSDCDIVCKNYMFAFKNECDNILITSSSMKSTNYYYDKTTNTICLKDSNETLCSISPNAAGLYTIDKKYNIIDAGAFYGRDSVTDIELGSNVKRLKNNSLRCTKKLNSIICRSSNIEIDPYLFGDPSDGAKVPNIKIYVKATDYETYLKEWSKVLDPVYGTNTAKNLLALDEGNIIYEDGAKYQKYVYGNKTRYRLLKVYETNKTSFKIKDETTQITSGAFDDCKKLEILYLPSHLESYDKDLFKDCDSLETIINSTTSLNVQVAKSSVEVFHVGADYQNFLYEDGVIYAKSFDGTYTLLNVPTDFQSELILKPKTKKLYDRSLSKCNKLTNLIISDPGAVEEIGNSCFEETQLAGTFNFSDLKNLKLIGKCAFKNCTLLNDIILPDQLVSLEDQTFYGCTNLETVTASGVETIHDEVFSECLALKEIKGYDHIKTIGDLAFYNCHTLTNLILDKSVTKIGEECFENCINLRSITMNGSITAISRYCFYGCEKLVEISMSDQQRAALKIIGVNAFSECTSLKNPDFSELTSLTQIGESAFENCNEMISIKLPKSLNKIAANCFSGCDNLSVLQFNSEKAVSLDANIFGENLLHYIHILVPKSAFDTYRKTYINSLDPTYGNGTTDKILEIIDPNTEYLKGIRYELTENGRILKKVEDDFEGEFTVLEDTIKIEDDAFKNCSKITKLTIPEGTTVELGDRCFKDCTNLKEINLYGNIPVWGDEVFMGCINLKEMTIGYSTSNIPRIGTRAFKGCSGLTDISSIVIAAHIKNIGTEAFMDCTNLPAIGFVINSVNGDSRKSINIIEDHAFENCKSLTSFLTSSFSNVTTIGNYAFKGCTSLKQPSLAQSVTSIGEGCFMDCENLLYVSFYGAVKEYPKNCFKNCPKLIRTGGTALAFSSLKRIGDGAYEGCRSLTSSTSWYLQRYANLEEIGDYAFKDCTNLSASKLSSTVLKIGVHAFDGCTNMSSLTLCGATPPIIGLFSPETMADGFLLKVPDSKESDDKIYKAYFEQLKNTFGSEDKIYPMLDSISDGAMERNTPAKTQEGDKE